MDDFDKGIVHELSKTIFSESNVKVERLNGTSLEFSRLMMILIGLTEKDSYWAVEIITVNFLRNRLSSKSCECF